MIDDILFRRIAELSDRSNARNIYTFGDFLSPADCAEIERMRLSAPVSFFGGADFCERKMPRFGSAESCGYEEGFPISVICIGQTDGKFSEPLTHRDFLGSIMGLGIDRSKTGDIFVGGSVAYACVHSNLAEFIVQNLTRCGRSSVAARIVPKVPDGLAPKREERIVSVSSVRLDAMICRVYGLSREEGADLFREGRVYVCGRQISSPSYVPKEGDEVSVRGRGKLILNGAAGKTAKGKTRYSVSIFV